MNRPSFQDGLTGRLQRESSQYEFLGVLECFNVPVVAILFGSKISSQEHDSYPVCARENRPDFSIQSVQLQRPNTPLGAHQSDIGRKRSFETLKSPLSEILHINSRRGGCCAHIQSFNSDKPVQK